MTIQNFNEQKEKQAKTINVVLQTVKENSFSDQVKEQVETLSKYAIELIYESRKAVLAEIGESYEAEKLEHEHENAASFAIKISGTDTVNGLRQVLSKLVSQIIAEVEKEYVTSITNNTDIVTKTKEIKKINVELLDVLEELNKSMFLEEIENAPENAPEQTEQTEQTEAGE